MRRDPICMDSSKRRRIEVIDRLSDLPGCLLHDVLSRLVPQQAVQTSVLSSRWRHLWRQVLPAIVVIDEREFAGQQWELFEDFADRLLLSIAPETKLDYFHLNLVSPRGSYDHPSFETSDRWIRRALRHCPAAVHIRAAQESTICWKPHCSYFSAPGLQPDLSVIGSCAAGFTGRLTMLHLVGVIVSATFAEDLGKYCPVLLDLHVERCKMLHLTTVSSPTLTSLTIVEPRRPLTCAHLMIVAPRLVQLRLELAYDGEDCQCVAAALATGREIPRPMAWLALVEVSIRLTDTSYDWQANQRARKKRKVEFLKSMGGFPALIPNVVKLRLSGFTTPALVEQESQEFPVLHRLKTLILEGCDLGVKFQALAGFLRNTPDLEKLGLYNCTFLCPSVKRSKRGQQTSKSHISTPNLLWCEKLESIEIKRPQEDEPLLAKLLSEISEKMQPELWRRVNVSSTTV